MTQCARCEEMFEDIGTVGIYCKPCSLQIKSAKPRPARESYKALWREIRQDRGYATVTDGDIDARERRAVIRSYYNRVDEVDKYSDGSWIWRKLPKPNNLELNDRAYMQFGKIV